MKRRRYLTAAQLEQGRRRLRLARSRVRVLTRLALLVLFAELAAAALTSPRFAVKGVTLEGAGDLTREFALRTVSPAVGTNLFLAPCGRLRGRLESHPAVRRAEVVRKRDGRLLVRVEERSPYVCVLWKGSYFSLDREMVPFVRAEARDRSLPLIDAPGAGAPEMGRPWSSAYVEAAVRCLEEARKSDLKVSQVSIDPAGEMCLNIVNGTKIRAGYPQDIERKISVATRVLASLPVPLDSVLYVDVSCPGAPAYRPKGSDGATAVH